MRLSRCIDAENRDEKRGPVAPRPLPNAKQWPCNGQNRLFDGKARRGGQGAGFRR